ncbi:protein of unknown function [Paenibacillus alvei]|uniref:Uncharacterized protein n=1 Tax=Paenibacillus alvei TaxID=44250 RepID=A0A383R7U6_PAEAL|nr:protein of unknown function [Paenibacillus alvei]
MVEAPIKMKRSIIEMKAIKMSQRMSGHSTVARSKSSVMWNTSTYGTKANTALAAEQMQEAISLAHWFCTSRSINGKGVVAMMQHLPSLSQTVNLKRNSK